MEVGLEEHILNTLSEVLWRQLKIEDEEEDDQIKQRQTFKKKTDFP